MSKVIASDNTYGSLTMATFLSTVGGDSILRRGDRDVP